MGMWRPERGLGTHGREWGEVAIGEGPEPGTFRFGIHRLGSEWFTVQTHVRGGEGVLIPERVLGKAGFGGDDGDLLRVVEVEEDPAVGPAVAGILRLHQDGGQGHVPRKPSAGQPHDPRHEPPPKGPPHERPFEPEHERRAEETDLRSGDRPLRGLGVDMGERAHRTAYASKPSWRRIPTESE